MDRLTVNARTACKMIGIGLTKFYQLVNENQMPVPKLTIGKRNMWRIKDINGWVESGFDMDWKPRSEMWDKILDKV